MQRDSTHAELLARYKAMRAISFRLNNDVLPKYASAGVLKEAGRQLGVWKHETMVFDTEDQVGVLMDYAYYDCFRRGENAVARYAAENPPAPTSDEEALLAAMKEAFFSIFQVEEVISNVGVRVSDLLTRRRHLIVDLGFAETTVPDFVIASRILPFEDFAITGGAALPVDADALEDIRDHLRARRIALKHLDSMDRQTRADLNAAIIRICLDNGASEDIEYREVGEHPEDDRLIPVVSTRPKIGRNDPCPCGSGRKYKKCCGR